MKDASNPLRTFIGGGLSLALLVAVNSNAAAQGTITLNFSSLPSAQGWTYLSDGAPEASIFSVSGGVLTQNTASFTGAATVQFYQRSAVTSLPFTISVQARILADSTTGQGQPNAFGFCFFGATGAEIFGIGLDTGRIQAINNVVLSTTIDNTQFHDYRLVATPGVGFALYVDNVLLATGTPRVDPSNAGLLGLGDCTRGQGALAEVTRYVFTQVLQVGIDIKPGSFPNSINPRSRGTTPVALLSGPTFNAPARVDKASLTFGRTGNEQSLAFCTSSPEDVNSDGLLDLVCHFDAEKTGFQTGDTQGVLKGKTVDGVAIMGTDSVRIVP